MFGLGTGAAEVPHHCVGLAWHSLVRAPPQRAGFTLHLLCELCSAGAGSGEVEPRRASGSGHVNGPSLPFGEPFTSWTFTFLSSLPAGVSGDELKNIHQASCHLLSL